MKLTPEEIETVVLEALQATTPGLDVTQRDADLVAELGLDSMQVMNLAMEIEDRLDMSIPVEVLSRVRTLRELSRALAEQAGGRRA